ncbi:XRE family transcriptional regulator [Tenacibaculum larymnensis]|uniref:Helix-turn-helix domain-containing protein n=1 Tax=Tenacibaculum larymnensis TaxID=2878201 RepID=A0A9X4ILM1_9FLAO|nr:XRE family transcriptional regulator [Tenacibaculum larymnensis]MDE1206708.1 helix-turn-helix domain-containing protein [Tenacibaculum larymnensis]
MNSNTMNLRDIKKMRVARHWSQEQLAEMSGLSIRTIQRIESGENAGLESLKSLAAVFETNIESSNKKEALDQIRKEEAYILKLQGFYKLLAIALFSIFIPIILAFNDAFFWGITLWVLLGWLVIIVIYSLNNFEFFGDEWRRKKIKKKFENKKK